MKTLIAGASSALALVLVLSAPMASQAGLFGHKSHPAAAKTVAGDSAQATAMADQIKLAVEERRYVDAADLLEKAHIENLTSPRFVTLSAEMYLAHGSMPEALTGFRAAEAFPSEKVEAEQGEGIILSLTGHSDDAVAKLTAATTADKNLWRAWNALGREYDLRRDWKKSAAAYAAALAAPGANQAIVLNNRGYSHLLQNDTTAAAADFVAALDKDASLAAARTNLRITLAMQGQYARAAMTGDGDDKAAVLNNVGLTAAVRGDYMEAEKLLNQAIALKGQYYSRAAENLQLSKALAQRAEESPPPSMHDAH